MPLSAAEAYQIDAPFSAADVCRLAGVSYRMLDYWCRQGALEAAVPARGSGSARRFTLDQVVLVRAYGCLSALNAEVPDMVALDEALDRSPDLWDAVLFVAPGGRVVAQTAAATPARAWLVNMAACWAHVTGQLGGAAVAATA